MQVAIVTQSVLDKPVRHALENNTALQVAGPTTATAVTSQKTVSRAGSRRKATHAAGISDSSVDKV